MEHAAGGVDGEEGQEYCLWDREPVGSGWMLITMAYTTRAPVPVSNALRLGCGCEGDDPPEPGTANSRLSTLVTC